MLRFATISAHPRFIVHTSYLPHARQAWLARYSGARPLGVQDLARLLGLAHSSWDVVSRRLAMRTCVPSGYDRLEGPFSPPSFWSFPRQFVDCYGTLDSHKEVYCRTVAYEGRGGVLLLR